VLMASQYPESCPPKKPLKRAKKGLKAAKKDARSREAAKASSFFDLLAPKDHAAHDGQGQVTCPSRKSTPKLKKGASKKGPAKGQREEAEHEAAAPVAEEALPTTASTAETLASRLRQKGTAKRKAAVVSGPSPPPPAAAEDLASKLKEKISAKRKARSADQDDASTKRHRCADGSAIAACEVTVVGATAFRKAHDIKVSSSSCPEPMESFALAEAQFGKVFGSAFREQGYTRPTPIQAQAWPIALLGDDIVAVAKTGSGKTCGFLIPALYRLEKKGLLGSATDQARKPGDAAMPYVLVVAPTRELVQQIAVEAEKFSDFVGARVVSLYGGVAKGDQVRTCRQGADIVVATTGRLLDFCKGQEGRDLAPCVSLERVNYLVLDEADRMLDMGFEPDVRQIVQKCPRSGTSEQAQAGITRQTLFFTATWPEKVQKAAKAFTTPGAVQVRIGQGAGGNQLTANMNVAQTVHVLGERDKLEKLKSTIQKDLKPGETAVVFAKRKATCDFLERELRRVVDVAPICAWCRAIHGDKEQWEREEALNAFRTMTADAKGRKGVLVASDVAARGLDIPGIALVVVYDFSGGDLKEDSGIEAYVHRIGRTGRAGKQGRAVTFFTDQDAGADKFVALLKGAKQPVPKKLEALAAEATSWHDNKWVKKDGGNWKGGGGHWKGGAGQWKGGGRGKRW